MKRRISKGQRGEWRPRRHGTCGSHVAALALLAGLLGPTAVQVAVADAQTSRGGAWRFVSQPELNPPSVAVSVGRSTAPGQVSGGTREAPSYLFLAPIKAYEHREPFVGYAGPEILEPNGTPVWEDPLRGLIKTGSTGYPRVAMDFHPTTYEGQPVLTWWQGYISPQGFGNGYWVIMNEHYRTIATVRAPHGYATDFHAFHLTSAGTAYLFASRLVKLSLHCCGGPSNGELYDQVLLEVDVKTGQVVWQWDPLQHVPLRESYTAPPSSRPWDPYHFNSVSLGPGGNAIVSARNTWAAYWVSRTTKQVFATLGGKRSTFRLGSGAHFAWQHDVRAQSGDEISLFDDEAAPVEAKQSRGLVLALDWAHRAVSVAHEYLLPRPALAGSQGNVQLLPDGNYFVGWGQLPYFSEYSPTGTMTYEGALSGPDESYRAFRGAWVGQPSEGPAAAAQTVPGGAVDIYASWNGATGVAAWQLLAGSSKSALSPVGRPVARAGFETVLTDKSPTSYYAAEALDAAGRALGTSTAVSASAIAAHAIRASRLPTQIPRSQSPEPDQCTSAHSACTMLLPATPIASSARITR